MKISAEAVVVVMVVVLMMVTVIRVIDFRWW
mgnify:CR=1 FL=1